MSLTINGVLTKLLERKSGQSNSGTWIKQEFVIQTKGDYPKNICFSAWNDLTDKVGQLKIGEDLEISFNAESREWEGKYFTELKAWKIKSNAVNSGFNSQKSNVQEKQVENVEVNDLPWD